MKVAIFVIFIQSLSDKKINRDQKKVIQSNTDLIDFLAPYLINISGINSITLNNSLTQSEF